MEEESYFSAMVTFFKENSKTEKLSRVSTTLAKEITTTAISKTTRDMAKGFSLVRIKIWNMKENSRKTIQME